MLDKQVEINYKQPLLCLESLTTDANFSTSLDTP